MMASDPSPWHSVTAASDPEAQLQQELRALFEVDTQQNLQDYFRLLQHLSSESWTGDIQHLYRAVHTIKGGAITVDAEAMLQAGIALEDLLSDLRFLEQSPDLTDGHLQHLLLEAGELLSSSLDITGTRETAIAQVQPTVLRIQTIHELIKQRYIPDWNELKQVHQEFAEQGFALVVLDLEMALDRLSLEPALTEEVVQIAQHTLMQLAAIGQELQFAAGWTVLLQACEGLVQRTNCLEWQHVWPQFFQALKDCARQGGELNETAWNDSLSPSVTEKGDAPQDAVTPTDVAPSITLDQCVDGEKPVDFNTQIDLEQPLDLDHPIDLDLMDQFNFDLNLDALDVLEPQPEESTISDEDGFPYTEDLSIDGEAIADLQHFDLDFDPWASDPDPLSFEEPGVTSLEVPPLEDRPINPFDTFIERPIPSISELLTEIPPEASLEPLEQPDSVATPLDAPTNAPTPEATAEVKRSIQVSVPLERLDQSAQQVVDALLTARAVMNGTQTLQTQLAQLASFTQESAQFVTRLRQLQDDYALLRTLSDEQQSGSNVPLERYRQGYTTLNRLLENILRMSELGQEIATITHQTTERVDRLDRSILRLKDSIESSRLVPFSGLSLRARAIVRDLSNRYGKPVELVVRGEEIELDAAIVQRLEPALLHLLRNAYDHGLEPVSVRLAQGKPAQGTIHLMLQRRGNVYRLTLEDDGSGIDAAAIQRLAQSKGFALTQTRTPAELLAVLCQPGFSSRDAVSDVSGRGVGMDVVAGQIADLGGKFGLETLPGQGTLFEIEIPAPQLLVPCVLMQVGDRTVAFPTDEILETILLNSDQTTPLQSLNSLCNWTIQTHQGIAPGFDLGAYWLQAESRIGDGVKPLSETAIALRTRKPDTETDQPHPWFIADDLLGQEELLITPLPNPLVAPAGLLGVSLQPDGRLISVLDPMTLAVAIQTKPVVVPEPGHPSAQTTPAETQTFRILVVDDAALMRRRIEGSLNTYGFSTTTCTDGLEAWNWLQANELPDLMITDVEMPNLDGFTLIDRCRQSGFEMPILVVSSRLSEEWGKEARRLGASDYLNKGFSTPELMTKVNGLLKAEASLAGSV